MKECIETNTIFCLLSNCPWKCTRYFRYKHNKCSQIR